MLVAMALSAVLCIAIGVWPDLLFRWLPLPMDYQPYTIAHVVTQLQLLLFAVLAFVLLIKFRLYPPEIKSTNLDFDWTYRRLAPAIVRGAGYVIGAMNSGVRGMVRRRVQRFIARLYRLHGPEGELARTWPSGYISMWIAVLLVIALLINYL